MADLEENFNLPASPTSKFLIKRTAFGSPIHAASHTNLKQVLDNSYSGSSEDDNDIDSPLRQFLHATEGETSNSKLITKAKELAPANPLENKQYSMEPDMLFGWKPKYVPQVPVPLRFFSPMLEEVINALHKPGTPGQFPEVVYQGFRPENSLLMHERFGSDEAYNIKFSPFVLSKHALFCKFVGNNVINPKRPFMGMKEGVQGDCLVFDSIFEHGNLDTVVRKAVNEYDLFLRVDSNTKGHTAWYYFTIKNMKKGQRVKFNILNLSKSDSLYQRGMKPYVYSQKLNSLNSTDWIQKGENVSYTPSTVSYNGQTFEEPHGKKYYKVSFEYTFEYTDDTVSFALCAPYTYTRLVQYIQSLVDEQKGIKAGSHLGTSKLCYSLGGISIPMLTITDPDESEIPIAKRQYIVCTGRAHPGETNASWMIQGFINEICNDKPETKYLRKRFVFKIVPMLNPDGVVAGNHRTGMCGNDLNRKFVTPKDVLHPNIIALRDTVKDIVNNEREVFAYLDFHGHSLKKNVFMYGAEFPVYDQNYYRVKILPKLLSNRNPMFRFRSCIFTLSKPKMTTARAVFSMKYGVAHFYTIEASYANYVNLDRETVAFDANGFMEMGASVAGGLHDYRKLLDEEETAAASLKLKKEDLMKMMMMKQEIEEVEFEKIPPGKLKSVQFKEDKIGARMPSDNFLGGKEAQENDRRRNKKFIIRKGKGMEVEGYQANSGDVSTDSNRKVKTDSQRGKDVESQMEMKGMMKKPKIGIFSLMEEIREDFLGRKEEDRAESDNFSEGGSDSEGSEDDFNGEDMKKMQKNILMRVDKFQDICKNGEKYDTKTYRKEKKSKKTVGTVKDAKSPKREKPKGAASMGGKGSDQSPKEKKLSESVKASNRQGTNKSDAVADKQITNRVAMSQKKEDVVIRPSSSKPKFSLAPKEVQIDNAESTGQIKNQLSSFYLGTLGSTRKNGIRNSLTGHSSRKQTEAQIKTQKTHELGSVRPVDGNTDCKPIAALEAAKIIHMNSQMEKSYQAQRPSKSPLDLLFSMKGGPAPATLLFREPEFTSEGEAFLNLHVDKLFRPTLSKLKDGDYTPAHGLSKLRTGKDAYSLDQDNIRDLFGSPYSAKMTSYQPSIMKQNTVNLEPSQDEETVTSVTKQGSKTKPAFVRVPYMTVGTAQIYNTYKPDLGVPGKTPLKKDSKLPISFETYKKMLHLRRKETEDTTARKSTAGK